MKRPISEKYADTINLIRKVSQLEEPSQTDIEIIKKDFQEYIEFVKQYFSMKRHIYYNLILQQYEEFSVDFNFRGPITTDIDASIPSSPEIRMKVNPLFFGDISLKEFFGLVEAEILRISYLHHSAFKKINPDADQKKHQHLEEGSDASIMELLMSDIVNDKTISIPKNLCSTNDIENFTKVSLKKNGTLEYYYGVGQKFDKRKGDENGSMCSTGSGGSNGQKKIATPKNNEGEPSHNWEKSEGNPTETEKAEKEILRRAYTKMSEQQRGTLPGGLKTLIEKNLEKPKISWREIFMKFFGTIPVSKRKSPFRLNRRFPERFDLRGTLPDRECKVVVAIDTSGSVSNKALSYIFNEIFDMTEGRNAEIIIIECDYSIGKIYRAETRDDVDLKVSGRGGTAFTPVIEFLNGTGNQFKDDPLYGNADDAVLVYFTDGYGEYSIPEPRTHANLWIILDDEKNLSLREPYGAVKSLKDDDKYINS